MQNSWYIVAGSLLVLLSAIPRCFWDIVSLLISTLCGHCPLLSLVQLLLASGSFHRNRINLLELLQPHTPPRSLQITLFRESRVCAASVGSLVTLSCFALTSEFAPRADDGARHEHSMTSSRETSLEADCLFQRLSFTRCFCLLLIRNPKNVVTPLYRPPRNGTILVRIERQIRMTA